MVVYYIIIVIFIIFAAAVAYSMFSKRKFYHQIDELESRKIDIMSRPVTNEMAKMKRLKMYGETEEKFLLWCEEWDNIVADELPKVDERLFEAEEEVDKYHFGRAKVVLNNIRDTLEQAEKRTENMLAGLDELMSSEEQNRREIATAEDVYQEIKKNFSINRHLFQPAESLVEKEFYDIEAHIRKCQGQMEDGNYLEARNMLKEIQESLATLQQKIGQIPELLATLGDTLPDQMKELRTGYQHMVKQGYTLDHLKMEEKLKSFGGRIHESILAVEKLNMDQPQNEIDDIQGQMDQLYDQLEGEIASKQFVVKEAPVIKERLDVVEKNIDELKQEIELVKQNYQIDEEDLASFMAVQRESDLLRGSLEDMQKAIQNGGHAYSKLRSQLEKLRIGLDQLENQRTENKEALQTLRKDELHAKDTLMSLRKQLIESKRSMQKSNLPGLPYHYLTNLESAEEKMAEVEEKLNEKRLEMGVINQILGEAAKEVNSSCTQMKKMIEDATLAEQLIQYGNRYRSKYPDVSSRLTAAEAAFRHFQYEEALEIAASGIQTVEPDILKKFKVPLKEQIE